MPTYITEPEELQQALDNPPRSDPLCIGYYKKSNGEVTRRIQLFKKGSEHCEPADGLPAEEVLQKLAQKHLVVRNSNGFLKITGDEKFQAWKEKTWTKEKIEAHRQKYGIEVLSEEERKKRMEEGRKKGQETLRKKREALKAEKAQAEATASPEK